MTHRWGIGAGIAVLTAVACGSSSDSAGPSTANDAGLDGSITTHDSGGSSGATNDGGPTPSDAGPQHGAVVLTVHTQRQELAAAKRTSRVFLGDGSKWSGIADDKGDVVFDDPAITLPQDVTAVSTAGETPSDPPEATTIVGVDRSEIWLEPNPSSDPPTVRGSISGSVLGAAGNIGVEAAGSSYTGTATGFAGGSYSMELAGYQTGPLNLLAYARASATDPVTKVGMVTNLSFTGGAVQQDITLDHDVDQSLTVTVTGDGPYGGSGAPTLEFRAAWVFEVAFRTNGKLPFPVSVATPAMTAPLDTALSRRVLVLASHTGDSRNTSNIDPSKFIGSVGKIVPGGATSVQVDYLPTCAITAPALGKVTTPAHVSAAAFTLTLANAPAANIANLRIESTSDPNQSWEVWLPASRTTFTFPNINAGNGQPVLKSNETYLVEYRVFDHPEVPNLQDLFGPVRKYDRTYGPDVRESDQYGYWQLDP